MPADPHALPPAYAQVPEHIRRAAKETAAKAPPLSAAQVSQIAALLMPHLASPSAGKTRRALRRTA